MADKRYVYAFDEAYGLGKEILGGKGAGLAEMSHIGVPVPEGFTITTEACTLYYESGKQIPEYVIEEIFNNIIMFVLFYSLWLSNGTTIYFGARCRW